MADQSKVEAGREKLAAYKKKKRDTHSRNKPNTSPKSVSSAHSSGMLDSSVAETSMTSNESMSPTAGQQDIRKLATRVRDLEELIEGKNAAMLAMQERLDTSADLSADISAGMLSFGLEADYKTHLERFQHRLEEFAAAVAQRDELIAQLSSRLQDVAQTAEEREQRLTAEAALLQRQLRAALDLVQGHAWDTGVDPQQFITLQNQNLALEDTVTKNKAVIDALNATIQQHEVALKSKTDELDQKAHELAAHKAQAAAEVQELMRTVEELNQQSAMAAAGNSPDDSLRLQLEEDFGMQLAKMKEELRSQLAQELKQCRQTHIKEMEVLRQQNETLEMELDALTTDEGNCKSELNACKEAYIAQWGSNKLAGEVELASLRQKVVALTAQLDSVQKLPLTHEALTQSQSAPLASARQTEMEGELRSLHESEVACLKETIERLGQQVEELLAAQKTLAKENAVFASQIETYKVWLSERTAMANRNGQDVFDLQKELSDYKNQLERLDSRHTANNSAMLQKHEEQTKELNDRLGDVNQKLLEREKDCESYKNELDQLESKHSAKTLAMRQTYEDQMKELNDWLSDVNSKMLEREKECERYRNEFNQLENKHSTNDSAIRQKYEEQIKELSHQLRDVNEKVLKDCESYKNELVLLENKHSANNLAIVKKYEGQMKEMNDRLNDVNNKMLETQKECETYKNELNQLENEHSANNSAMRQKYEEEIRDLNNRLSNVNQEVIERQKECESYRNELNQLENKHSANNSTMQQKYEDRVNELSNQLGDVNQKVLEREKECECYKNELQECKESMKDLDDSRTMEMAEVRESYDIELKNLQNTHKTELEDLNQQIHELHSQLTKESIHIEHSPESSDQSVLPAMRIKIRDLQNVVKHREETHASIQSQLLDSVAKLQALQALLHGKEELEQSLIEKERELSHFNETFTSLQEDKCSLEKRVHELEDQLRDAKTSQSEKNEAHNEAELIANLRNRIDELETALRELNAGSQALRETLQETVVQCLTAQTVSCTKDELISSLHGRIQELEDSLRDVNDMSKSMKAESDRMMAQVAKAKELLKRSKVERDDLIAACKRSEDESSDLRKLLATTEEKLAASIEKVGNLEFVAAQLHRLEKENEEMAGRCDSYEAEAIRLREQLASSETSLEGVRQELSNNRAPQCNEPGDYIVERRETMFIGGGDNMAEMSFMGASFFNNTNNFHNVTEYMEVAGLNTSGALNLIDNCTKLETVRHQLENDAESLHARLKEKELAVELNAEEVADLKARCADLEATIVGLRNDLADAGKNIADRNELETQVGTLSDELQSLKGIQDKLRSELFEKQVVYEDKLHKMLQEQLCRSSAHDDHSIEDLIYELGSRAKEVIVLQEKLATTEQAEETLQRRLQESADKVQRLTGRLSASEAEKAETRAELAEALQGQRRAEEEAAKASRELAVARLTNEHLNDSLARTRDVDDGASLEAAKTALLKLALLHESALPLPPDSFVAEGGAEGGDEGDLDAGLTELRGKLQGIFSREVAARKVDGKADLAAELSFYREQHATLADVIGSTGVLEEVLHRQKQELVRKLEEKAAVERQLDSERSRLAASQLRLEMLERQMAEKDSTFAELERQKRLVEADLRRIEEQLREKEDTLMSQRQTLEAQIRDRDLRIRHWQVQCRANQMELSYARASPPLEAVPAASSSMALDRLDLVRRDLNAAHDAALARLKLHLRQVFSAQETELDARHAAHLAATQDQHRQQLATIQQELQEKCKDLESKLSQIHNEKEELDVDLEEMKIKLDGSQKEIFDVLQKKFKVFGQKQVTAAIERVKSEHERVVANLTVVHAQELVALQYKLEQKNSKQLLHVKQELLQTYEKDLKRFQQASAAEIASLSEVPKLHPTDSRSALDLLKQFLCREFTLSFKALKDARYSKYEEELSRLSTQLEAALKEVDPRAAEEVHLLLDVEEELIEQTQGVVETLVSDHARLAEALGGHLDAVNAQLLAFLEQTAGDVREAVDVNTMRDQLEELREQRQRLDQEHSEALEGLQRERDETAARLERLLSAAGVECGPCAVARAELEARHRREVEELRTYFEQKCADVEKHYSEEVFSQHSRKLSTGSSSCENELVADMYYGTESRSPAAQGHTCDVLEAPGYKEIEAQCRHEYETRLAEYRTQLDSAKTALEDTYRAEMASLKKEYDTKVDDLAISLSTSHQTNVELETKHKKEMQNVRAQMQEAVEKVRRELEEVHLRQLADLKESCEAKLATEVEGLTARMMKDEAEHVDAMRNELQAKHDEEVKRLGRLLDEKDEEMQIAESRGKHKQDVVEQLETLLAERGEGFGSEFRKQLQDLQDKHQAELECERNHVAEQVAEQVEQVTEMIKLGAEQEQEKFMRVQKDIMSGFLLQHEQDVQVLTQQFEARLHTAQEEIRKLNKEQEEYADSIMQSKQRLYIEVQNDVLKSLDEHLQVLFSSEGSSAACPPALLQLQDKFSARYEQQLVALRRELASARQRNGVHVSAADESSALPEQNNEPTAQHDKADFRQMARTMKQLVCELAKYVSVCEDELNNTLVEQILRNAEESTTDDVMRDAPDESYSVSNGSMMPFVSMMSDLDTTDADVGNKTASDSLSNDMSYVSDKNGVGGEPAWSRSPKRKVRRVHFAPNISNIVNMDEDSLVDYIGSHKDVSDGIRNELDSCLDRLKAEAASILGRAKKTSGQAQGQKHLELSRQLAAEVSTREELERRLADMEPCQAECTRLSAELASSQQRLADLEGREDVSEGYGEQGRSARARRAETLAELQDQARSILSEGSAKTPQLQLIEELCREGDMLVEESKHERDDLQQQVDAADKQLRATRQFLEEQAAEREQERDDFLAEIQRLKELHRSGEQLKVERLTKEVETLETQVKEASALLKDADAKKVELEVELKAAIDKVWVLRDIISDLEAQVETKSRNEVALEEQLLEQRTLVEQQTQNNHDLSSQLDCSHVEMAAHISSLEDQLRRHHQQMELLQPESVRQMKSTLREFETTLDKKTKDLESLYVTNNSNASSPSLSEDVSISRDQMDVVRSATPEGGPISLPLAQLLRLQDKLAAHSRAEQAALKQIRDLDMEMAAVRRDRDEARGERDSLQERLGEQLLTISRLRANVDGQRQATDEQVERACADLRKRLTASDAKARDLALALATAEQKMEASNTLLEQTRQAAAAVEADWRTLVKREQDAAQKLRVECAQLREQNAAHVNTDNERATRDLVAQTELTKRDKRISELETEQRRQEISEQELRLTLEGRDKRVSELQAKLAEIPKLEAEIQSLREQLANIASAQVVTLTATENSALCQSAPASKAASVKDAVPEKSSDSLIAILNKILATGFQSLSFAELSLLHERVLAASGKAVLSSPGLKLVPAATELPAADNQELSNRVQMLQKELARREKDAQGKMGWLEKCVLTEKQRLEEATQWLNEATQSLANEQRRCAEISAINEQLQHETDAAADVVNSLQQQLEKEKARNRGLDSELAKTRNANKHAQTMLDSERQRSISTNLKESDVMAAMRMKLEASLESESKLRAKLDRLEALHQSSAATAPVKQPRKGKAATAQEPPSPRKHVTVQTSPQTSPQKPSSVPSQSKSFTDLQEALEHEKAEAVTLGLALRQEQRRTSQLEALVEREKRQMAQRIEAERERSKKLRKQMQALEEDKENLNLQLDGARDSLSSQQLICANLERTLSDERESTTVRCQRWTAEEERLRSALAGAEVHRLRLEERVLELEARLLETSDGRERLASPDGAPNAAISAPMLQKLKATNALLEKHVQENAEVSLAMSRLTEDRQRLQQRVRELEARLAQRSPNTNGLRSADKEMEIVNELLSAERTTWSREKAALLNSLAQAEASKRQRDHSEDAEKMRHLFSKYLRVESYRKALAWQKRYLLIVISGYQTAEAKAAEQIAHALPRHSDEPAYGADVVVSNPKKGRGISRFRSCCVVLIAVHRMKFLVRRWKHGRSIGGNTVFIHGSMESLASGTSSYLGARHRQGSTASSAWSARGISSVQRSPSPTRALRDGSSATRMPPRWDAEPQLSTRQPESMSGGLEPYQVAEYISRFDQLQQRLGLAVSPPSHS